ncbi:MAG: hypothetical protein ONB48_09740 [candidate division KSB1 bacterium]|nr:hypothetical protein [candidate division KSB1 bacterium]MDZ7273769.1 hypothetical protein [candidate division KSB1 bacterium]MDZ7285925.1 hypothetical protein [candidate division KSB1 bacterium]MDZ7298957.1 hypothetical protein [candidate division KSB1 bacterium]MDZ7308604.1 hypothetical protein [candidate division KSB1 bacterium]
MKYRIILWLLVFALGCGQSQQERQAGQSPAAGAASSGITAQDASREYGQSVMETPSAGGQAAHVEPVAFAELQKLLPASLAGLTRDEATGETAEVFGIKVSTAEAHYSDDEGRSITLKLTDLGSLQGLSSMATYAWAATDIDRQTESGYERTLTLHGYRGYEQFDRDDQSCILNVLVGNRFIVEVSGYQVSMAETRTALQQIDLKQLEGMKLRSRQ